MRRRIERVVNRDARRTKRAIGIHHRRAATIGEHHVDIGQCGAHRMRGIGTHFVQGGGGVDIPEDAQCPRPRLRDGTFQQLAIEHADAVGLDHDVSLAGLGQHAAHSERGCRIDDRASPFRWIDVAMLLPIERVRFVEGDVVAARREFA